jgi:UDP-N-acetylmuramoyl-L-alanyl-D-glutamate--2,6-diaminopimelate ligase
VLNADDPISVDYATAARDAGAEVHLYGSDAAAAIRAVSVREDQRGLRLTVSTTRWQADVLVHLPGRFNVHNALAAIGVGEALDLDPAQIRAGIEAVETVPGRMQRVDEGQPFRVVVDYAHTAEALGKVLDELRPSEPGAGLILVFGSAGERDTAKRPVMGRVAGERCRLVVVTDEDPRGEDRMAILEAIAEGAEAVGRRRGDDLLVIPDRAEAIATAVGRARPGDVVLLAGKGHERTIETAQGDRPWDEVAAARQALRSLGGG